MQSTKGETEQIKDKRHNDIVAHCTRERTTPQANMQLETAESNRFLEVCIIDGREIREK